MPPPVIDLKVQGIILFLAEYLPADHALLTFSFLFSASTSARVSGFRSGSQYLIGVLWLRRLLRNLFHHPLTPHLGLRPPMVLCSRPTAFLTPSCTHGFGAKGREGFGNRQGILGVSLDPLRNGSRSVASPTVLYETALMEPHRQHWSVLL
jgi:hypothetical protein